MNVLDLFSGIGGFSLGLERAGFKTVAFCEIDPYCRAVLKKHWPDVHVFGDIATLTGTDILANASWHVCAQQEARGAKRKRVREGSQSIDVICGGFPCQDISLAGKGAGIEGERSGLWKEYARIIGEVRPRYVIVENVAALLGRGLGVVLGDLAALGYDSEWHCIPASAVGAPHRRDRLWIVGHANAERCGWGQDDEGKTSAERNGAAAPSDVANTICNDGRPRGARRSNSGSAGKRESEQSFQNVANAERESERARLCEALADGVWRRRFSDPDWWLTEPNVGRVAHGVPARVDRLRALGNAVIPQIPEILGRAIMEVERQ